MTNQFNLPSTTLILDGIEQTTISARDLHERLDVTTRFNDWIIRRIESYAFVEGEDYYSNLSNNKDKGFNVSKHLGFGKNAKKEYYLTLDMAKELAMLENNEQGRAIRRGLIAMEKQLRDEVPALIRKQKAQIERLQNQREQLEKAATTLSPTWQKIKRYHAAGLLQKEMAMLLNCTPDTVRSHTKRMIAGGMLSDSSSTHESSKNQPSNSCYPSEQGQLL